jgi:L,D-transpeptidase YcbB
MRFQNILYVLLCFILVSCSSVVSDNSSDKVLETLEFSSDLKASLKGYIAQPDSESSILKKVYDMNEFVPFWVNERMELSNVGMEFSNILFKSMHYGLDTMRYDVIELRDKINGLNGTKSDISAIELDVLLTVQYFKFSNDISRGIVDTSQYHPEFGKRKPSRDLSGYLYESHIQGDVIERLLDLEPKKDEYKKLQASLALFLTEHALVDSSLKVRYYKKKSSVADSVKTYIEAKEALVLHDYIESNQVDDSVFFKGLQAFQINHGLTPDMKVGKNTANALSGNPYDFYKRAAVSLEKWKWANEWEDEYILANIATYKLKLYKDENLLQEHKVVVGTYANKTPELDSEIEYMVAYPFWTVPKSIRGNELVPKSKKDSMYLSRNNYQLLKGGKVVEMSTIDWKNISTDNFDYTIRQRGGSSNALGMIKFFFENKHSVYFHDTPSKEKFLNDIRSYSHGCVRVDEPMKLAEYLLAREGEICHIDSVHATIDKRQRKTITLQNNMPVHIRYFTAEGDQEGNIRFYPDIYRKEKELEDIIFPIVEEIEV